MGAKSDSQRGAQPRLPAAARSLESVEYVRIQAHVHMLCRVRREGATARGLQKSERGVFAKQPGPSVSRWSSLPEPVVRSFKRVLVNEFLGGVFCRQRSLPFKGFGKSECKTPFRLVVPALRRAAGHRYRIGRSHKNGSSRPRGSTRSATPATPATPAATARAPARPRPARACRARRARCCRASRVAPLPAGHASGAR